MRNMTALFLRLTYRVTTQRGTRTKRTSWVRPLTSGQFELVNRDAEYQGVTFTPVAMPGVSEVEYTLQDPDGNTYRHTVRPIEVIASVPAFQNPKYGNLSTTPQ